MASCVRCGQAAGPLAARRGGLCRRCDAERKQEQAEALRSYETILERLGQGDFTATTAEQLRQIEEATGLSQPAIDERRDQVWVRFYERLLTDTDGLSPQADRDLQQLEELMPEPKGFFRRHPPLWERCAVAVFSSDLPLPEVEDSTLNVGAGNAVHLELPADLLEHVRDYQTTTGGNLVPTKKWVTGDSGVLAITRFGVVFLGQIVHRDFSFEQILQMRPFTDGVHFHVHGYTEGMRFRLATASGQVTTTLIERLRRESREAVPQTTRRASKTWRRSR